MERGIFLIPRGRKRKKTEATRKRRKMFKPARIHAEFSLLIFSSWRRKEFERRDRLNKKVKEIRKKVNVR